MVPLPDETSTAVDALLTKCPEFLPAWQDLQGWMGDDTGIYSVFAQIVLPFLFYAIDGDIQLDHDNELDRYLPGNQHRLKFRNKDHWSAIPPRGSDELKELVDRLYEVIDLWAASPNADLRDAVYIEIIESGYGDLTADDLMRLAGPNVRSLARRNI